MKKYVILTILSLCLGYLMARFIFKIYDSDRYLTVSSNTNKYYFLNVGEYNSLEEVENNNTRLGNYIYINEGDKYYVYTCITKDTNMLSKLEEYYKELGFNTSVSQYVLSDNNLDDIISTTDMLLKESDEIKEICKQSILKYKEG
jgi:hypothetical protein